LYRDVLKKLRRALSANIGRPFNWTQPALRFHFNLGLLYYMHGKQYWPSAVSEFRTALSASGTSLSPSEVNLATQRRDKACQGNRFAGTDGRSPSAAARYIDRYFWWIQGLLCVCLLILLFLIAAIVQTALRPH